MSTEKLTKLVSELAGVIKFHELEAVDSKAAELLELVDHFCEEDPHQDDISNDEALDAWYRQLEQENLVKTTR